MRNKLCDIVFISVMIYVYICCLFIQIVILFTISTNQLVLVMSKIFLYLQIIQFFIKIMVTMVIMISASTFYFFFSYRITCYTDVHLVTSYTTFTVLGKKRLGVLNLSEWDRYAFLLLSVTMYLPG